MSTFQQQAVLWGQAYEVLVKRGVLTRLVEEGLIHADDPRLARWRQTKLSALLGAVKRELDLIDLAMRDAVEAQIEHLAVVCFGTGYTAIREYLRPLRGKIRAGKLAVEGIYCPLTLPGSTPNDDESREQTRSEFAAAFRLDGPHDPTWTDKGEPARADFLLWLSGSHSEEHLLVQEYSFDLQSELDDFRHEDAHLDELIRHRRLVETRGVFARIAAEVDGERFELADDLQQHLLALTSENKPLYKLCQASTYGESTERTLRTRGRMSKPCIVRALAITPNGLESLAARFSDSAAPEPRRTLMEQLGRAYRQGTKVADGDDAALTARVTAAFNSALRRLPRGLRDGLKPLKHAPEANQNFELEFTEAVTGFLNPMSTVSVDATLAAIDESDALTSFFDGSPRTAIRAGLSAGSGAAATLRDLHAAAIVAGMRAASPGRLTVLALEGNPGIGKTTAVIQNLSERDGGYLFAYLSPRVVINRDVTDKMARRRGEPTGTLTLTTNAQLISAAERWYRKQVDEGVGDPKRRVDSAVVVDGAVGLTYPQGNTLVISPEEEAEIETAVAGSRLWKSTLSEHEDLVQERALPGVLTTMAQTTRDVLELNPEVERVALTAALQGFRDKGGGHTTLEALSLLFKSREPASKTGIAERRAFAKRHPAIVVMVDELAGDGAGAPFVHAVTDWLSQQFLDNFEERGEQSPFTVVLVVSDASLANDLVLDRYLNAGARTPDKVLISPSNGAKPLDVTSNSIVIGGRRRSTLHVMANSYPASALDVTYRVRLSRVALEPKDAEMPSPRRAIRDAMGEAQLEVASKEIVQALDAGAKQVIYFAQDKAFLGDLRKALAADKPTGLDFDTVRILDASVPGRVRKWLVDPVNRDKIKVFLMTSSGARGVSFPKTDWIIAHVPRFSIEGALMELSQLVYRGRGSYQDEAGTFQNGDCVPRHLVMLVDDFVVSEDAPSPRQWLRQAFDLMTLVVMLRSTLLTRMTGDSGLRQRIAFVPVGGTGLDEILSLMAQYVTQFLSECEVFIRRHAEEEDRVRLLKRAQANVLELFSHARLDGDARKGTDPRSYSRPEEVQRVLTLATTAIAALLEDVKPLQDGDLPLLPDHVYFSGPLVLENWSHFDKLEMFTFEGHETQVTNRSTALFAQLKNIDEDDGFPQSLRVPALNILKVLSRERPAAIEFKTKKLLKSPNTWVAIPSGYAQFINAGFRDRGEVFRSRDPEAWHGALASSLLGGSAIAPAIPKYESFPWAATVGRVDPLALDRVFDDRYFMASSELNLLNTLMLEPTET